MQFERASRCVVSWCIIALGAFACSSNAGALCGPGTVPRAGGCELAPEHPLPFRVCGAGTRLDGTQCVPAGGAPNGGGDASAPRTADASMPAPGDASADGGDPVEVDRIAPVFGGVLRARSNSDSSIRLSWDAARDDRTPEAGLVYRVFVSKVAGGENYSAPALVTAPGATSVVVGGFEHAPTRYFFVVRAQDASGNVDDNTQEISAMAGYDQAAPAFAGCDTVLEASSSTIVVTWKAATDDVTPDNLIEYQIWMADSADAARAHSRAADQAIFGRTQVTFSSVPRGHRYYFYCEALDADRNAATNAVTKDILFDSPPTWPDIWTTFQFVRASRTTAEFSWSPATDDATPAADLVYVTTATASNGTITTESALGATGITLTGLAPGTSYTITVQAHDGGGLVDDNGFLTSFQTDASLALDIQPILSVECAIAGCHDTTTHASNLVLEAGRSYAELYGVEAEGPKAVGLIRYLVLPGAEDGFYFSQKVGNSFGAVIYGSPMPLVADGGFTTDWRLAELVTSWMVMGAPDN